MYCVHIFIYSVLYLSSPFRFSESEEFLEPWSRNNGVRKKSSAWRLFGGRIIKLLIYKTKTAIVSFMQCRMLIIHVSCFI